MDTQNTIPVAQPVQPVSPPQQQASQTGSTRALATLILGVLSLICGGFMTGIPAIILGHMELNAIKKGEAPKEGEGLAKVGYILGIVGTVLTCLAMLAIFFLMVLGISLGTSGALSEMIKT